MAIILVLLAASVPAQRIDSIHVFRQLPPGHYTSASANAAAWALFRQHAACMSVHGERMATAREAMASYEPYPHTYRPLPDLYRLAMGFSGGRPFTLGITDDLDLVINFTARTEYRIAGMTDRVRVRALLARMLVE